MGHAPPPQGPPPLRHAAAAAGLAQPEGAAGSPMHRGDRVGGRDESAGLPAWSVRSALAPLAELAPLQDTSTLNSTAASQYDAQRHVPAPPGLGQQRPGPPQQKDAGAPAPPQMSKRAMKAAAAAAARAPPPPKLSDCIAWGDLDARASVQLAPASPGAPVKEAGAGPGTGLDLGEEPLGSPATPAEQTRAPGAAMPGAPSKTASSATGSSRLSRDTPEGAAGWSPRGDAAQARNLMPGSLDAVTSQPPRQPAFAAGVSRAPGPPPPPPGLPPSQRSPLKPPGSALPAAQDAAEGRVSFAQIERGGAADLPAPGGTSANARPTSAQAQRAWLMLGRSIVGNGGLAGEGAPPRPGSAALVSPPAPTSAAKSGAGRPGAQGNKDLPGAARANMQSAASAEMYGGQSPPAAASQPSATTQAPGAPSFNPCFLTHTPMQGQLHPYDVPDANAAFSACVTLCQLIGQCGRDRSYRSLQHAAPAAPQDSL